MAQHGLLDSETDSRALTLQGRLVKDRAKLSNGAERARLFADSAALYAKAGSIDGASYSLINAGSLSLLAGKKAASEKLARDVLAALDDNPDEAETAYWLGATRAEAMLLLGQYAEARAALRKAVDKQPTAWEDQAATIGQFEVLSQELQIDSGWLDAIRPPRSVQYAGIMDVAEKDTSAQAQISDWLARENVGFGFGALAAGSDIWIAEALIERGAELHAVLPCSKDAFRDVSVGAIGEHWLPRFDRLIEQAATVEELQFAEKPDGASVTRAEAVACGMAVQSAHQLRSSAHSLRVAGLGETDFGATCVDTKVVQVKRAARVSRKPLKRGVGVCAIMHGDNGMGAFDNLEEALVAAQKSKSGAAIDYLPVETNSVPELAINRLAAMAESTGKGELYATSEAAFALLAGDHELRIENLGELRWAGGATPLYAIINSLQN